MRRQILATANAGDFVLANPGPCPAICIDVIDMGLMDGMYGPKYKIKIVFALAQQKEDGTPLTIGQMYTMSLHEKSKLGQHLVSWRGAPFTQDEKSHGFDIEKLVGAPAFVNIVHSTKGENTYANIETVMKMPAGYQPPAIPSGYQRELDRNPSKDVGSPYYQPGEKQLSPAAVAPAQNGSQAPPPQQQQLPPRQPVQQPVQQAPNNGQHTDNLYGNGFPTPALQQQQVAQAAPVANSFEPDDDLPF